MKSITIKQANDYTQIASCYHEAGHIIISIFYGIKVSSAIADSYGGICTILWHSINNLPPNLLKKVAENEIQALYAGLIAEKIYYKDISGSSSFPRMLYGSYDDYAEATLQIKKFNLAKPGPERAKYKKMLESRSEAILIEHWPSVKAIAHGLYKDKSLDFNKIKKILLKSNKSFWRGKFKIINSIYQDIESSVHIISKL